MGHTSSSARHLCLTPGPSLATLPSEMGVRTAAGGRSRPRRHAVAPAAPARLDSGLAPGLPKGVATRGFGRRRGGEVHGPPAGSRGPTAARAGRSSRRGHTPRCVQRDGRVVTHSARVGGGQARDAVSEGGGGVKWQVGGNFGAHARIGAEPRVARCPAWPRR